MSSVVKLPVILLATSALHICFLQPNPAPPQEEKFPKEVYPMATWHYNNIRRLFWIVAFAEAFMILRDYLFPGEYETMSLYLTSTSMIGALLIAVGAYIRQRCFAVMGTMFTVELTIRKNHKLITHGPYSIVRHPAYSGGIISLSGAMLWYSSEGSLLRESASWASKAVGTALLVTYILAFIVFPIRAHKEDKLLRERFGVEWDNWAQSVQFRIIPYVY